MTTPDPLRIMFLSAEAHPFAKVGGLADVVGALPKSLIELGAVPSIVLPAYRDIQRDEFEIQPLQNGRFEVPMGTHSATAALFRTCIPGTPIEVFLLDCPEYFDREGIYTDPATGEGFVDNMERYVFFMKAGLEALIRIGKRLDIIHCHDSQMGLIPGLLKTRYGGNPFFEHTGILLTIHNMAYQGIHPKESLTLAGIEWRHFYPGSPFEFWGQVNFLKAGIAYADTINTVSRTYAVEIQSGPEYGYGLEEFLSSRNEDLTGIVNGIDYSEWNPETDPFILSHFSESDLAGKQACKRRLQETFNLPKLSERTPLIGITSRLVDQKGLDLVSDAIEDIVSLDLQLVVLGMGQQKYHTMFESFARQHPTRIGVRLGFDQALAHQIQAGCDMILMPSRYEPCGLNQLYSLRYGTVPIVRATGGLADTVADYDERTGMGTGFRFDRYHTEEMIGAIRRALRIYSDPIRWEGIIKNGMAEDWSWHESARDYMKLYRQIMKKVGD